MIHSYIHERATVRINNILLAEDDDDDFYIFNCAVSSLIKSVHILRTANGVMLSSILQSQIHQDVIFLDINMPYKNGITCLKEIRSNPTFDNTRVIIYTTANHTREIELCYTLGATFYVIKPMSFSLTNSQLKDLFKNEYFIINRQPPPNEFVMNSQGKTNNTSNAMLFAQPMMVS